MRSRNSPEVQRVLDLWVHDPTQRSLESVKGPFFSEAQQLEGLFADNRRIIEKGQLGDRPVLVMTGLSFVDSEPPRYGHDPRHSLNVIKDRKHPRGEPSKLLFYVGNKSDGNGEEEKKFTLDTGTGVAEYFDAPATALSDDDAELFKSALLAAVEGIPDILEKRRKERKEIRQTIAILLGIVAFVGGGSGGGWFIKNNQDIIAQHAKERKAARLREWNKAATPIYGKPVGAPPLQQTVRFGVMSDFQFRQVPPLQDGDNLKAAKKTSIGNECEILPTHVDPKADIYIDVPRDDTVRSAQLVVSKDKAGELVICAPTDPFVDSDGYDYTVDVAIQARVNR